VLIITPLLRFVNFACCDKAPHCTHRLVPDSALKLYVDLVRLHKFIEGRLSSYPLCEVIPAKHGASPSEVLAAYSSWGAIHGSGGSSTRMALTLVDKVLRGTIKQSLPPTPVSDGGNNQKLAESASFSGGESSFASSRRHNSFDQQPDFTCGGYSGGARGGKASYHGNRDRSSGPPGGNRFNKFGDRSSGSATGGRSGGSSGYKSRY
jgi:hypothetical protein